VASRDIRIPDRVARIGLAQFDLLNSRAAELRASGRDVISLGQALPGFGPPEAALAAVREALSRPDAHVYSADAGLMSLRSALCDRLSADRIAAPAGVPARPDDIIVTAGGNQAFMLALMTLVDPGDEVLLPAPYFVNHQMAVAALGAIPTEVPIPEDRGFIVSWEDLEPHVTARTRAVVVCTPSNPTGAVVPHDTLARIVSELASRGIVLFSDETYGRFVHGSTASRAPSALDVPGWRENVVVVNTFSKSFGMTGWRVGYMVADARVCEQAIKIQDAMVICAPVLSQIGVEAALRQGWSHPIAFAGELRERKRILEEGLQPIPRLRWTPTGGGFFAFVRVAGCLDTAALAGDLLERTGLVVMPGSTFGRSGEGFIRLSYSAVPGEALREALARLAAYFA